MKFAIITFPGTSCERDVYYAVTHILGQRAEYIRHDCNNINALDSFDAIILPGGSSYGDALRPGSIAAVSAVIPALHRANEQGKIIMGICNGFQILTEAKLLPGVLLLNSDMTFVCKTMPIRVHTRSSIFTKRYGCGQVIQYPIAHAKGRYYCDSNTLRQLRDNNQIIFTYQDNVNGSVASIAGISNKAGNVLGLMPHPERALSGLNIDGLGLFQSIIERF